MTIASSVRTAGPYTGTGLVSAYAFGFKIFQSADLLVVITGTDGIRLTKTLNVDYTVALNPDQNVAAGGVVNLTVALPSSHKLEIYSAVPSTQPVSLTNQGGFYPRSIEDALDRIVILQQQVSQILSAQALRVPEAAGVAVLPAAAARANKVQAYDSLGNPAVVVGVDAASATALALDLLDVPTPSKGDSLIGQSAVFSVRDGVLTRHASLAAAISDIGSTRCTVVVRDDLTMAASVTVPATATLRIENRAQITTTGFTLTLNQREPVCAPVQCFAGSGTVVMTRVAEVYPEWWGAVADGSTDCAAAINTADAVACVGTLGLDGVTIVANSAVRFHPGVYRINSTLTYRGAPWIGSGVASTFIKLYASSGAAVNAVGLSTARKMVSIRGITFDGFAATGSAHGVRLGYNQRSYPAFDSVRIDGFPGPGIYFADQTWSMSFRDLYLSYNAGDSLFSGIYQDPAIPAAGLVALEFFNLQLENNGAVGSGKGGGFEFSNVQGFRFLGGVWEGNYGGAEAKVTGAEGLWIFGGHIESDVGSVDHGLVVLGASYGAIYGMTVTAETGFAGVGNAIYIGGTSIFTVDQIRSDGDWPSGNLGVADTAVVNFTGAGVVPVINVSAGAQFHRHTPKRVQLTDAANIATNAAAGTSFYVTLGGNRNMSAPTNPSVGQQITYTVTQDGTGGRTLGFDAAFKVLWSNTGNTAGKRSSITFEYDGANWNQVGVQTAYV